MASGILYVDYWLQPWAVLANARQGTNPLAVSEVLAYWRYTAWRALDFEREFLPAMQRLDSVWIAQSAKEREEREKKWKKR